MNPARPRAAGTSTGRAPAAPAGSSLATVPRASRLGPRPGGMGVRRFFDVLATQAFLTPLLFVFLALFVVPLGASVFLSFTNFNGYSTNFHFVGFSNYSSVLTNPQILGGLTFTVMYAVATTVAVTVLAIPLAVVFNRRFFGRNFVRAALFFPAVPSLLVLGLVWAYIFAPISSGVINSVLHTLFGMNPVLWLAEDRLAQLSVIIVGVWAQTGWHAVLYLAYLQSVPRDYYDAAVVDGASSPQQFFRITLPLLAPAMTVSVVLLITGGLRVYELPLSMTGGGGPGYSTYTVTQNILLYGVSDGQYGPGSALSVLFLVLVATTFVVVLSALRWREARLR